MRKLVLLGAAALLAACNNAEAPPADDMALNGTLPADENAAAGNLAGASATTATPMSLNETTWEFVQAGAPMVVSIDPAGAYIVETGDGKHVDHGSYAAKDGKDCFTSAMGDKQTTCYTTTPEVSVGASAPATDDKGVTVQYKRVEYRPLKMPV